jgi:putative copper export protein
VSELTWLAGSAIASILHVLGVAGVLGAIGATALLREQDAPAAMRRVLGVGAAAAALVIVAAGLRTVLQAAALAEEPQAWRSMVGPVLFESSLGIALRVQAAAAAAALIALVLARRFHTAALVLTVAAAVPLALSPGLGGHPAAAEQPMLALTLSAAHTVGVGLWLGTLGMLTAAATSLSDAAAAGAVRRFHRLAGGGLAVVVITGVVKLAMIAPPLGSLVSSEWGAALLVKLGAFGLVATLGWWHYRRADAALAGGRRREAFRSFAFELWLASVVLAATAVLINSSPPS